MTFCANCFSEQKEDETKCSHCGYERDKRRTGGDFLQPGYLLNEKYIIGKTLGSGGFGISYLAMDARLHIKYAIKEYFPASFCTRDKNTYEVTPYEGQPEKSFGDGKKGFLQEAKTAAQFNDLNSTVKVFDYFEYNNTAYMVMEYLQGENLLTYLNEQPAGRLNWAKTIEMLKPVIHAVGIIHQQRVIHRDISPDNIFVTDSGEVKLLDFGAARQAIGEQSQMLSTILKRGYAPPEQYSEKSKQGAYTDIYAICATLFRCVTGVVPPDAVERMMVDELDMGALKKVTSERVYTGILKGLSIDPTMRFSSVDELLAALVLDEADTQNEKPVRPQKAKWAILISACVLACVLVGALVFFNNSGKKEEVVTATPTPILTDSVNQSTIKRFEPNERDTVSINNAALSEQISAALGKDTFYKEDLSSVTVLEISDVNRLSLEELPRMENLQYIVYPYTLIDSVGIKTYEDLAIGISDDVLNVVQIDGRQGYSLEKIYGLPNTNAISITHCTQQVLDDVVTFFVGKGLKMISIESTADASLDLSGIASLSQLEHLRLNDIEGLTDIDFVARLTGLTDVYISGCEQVQSMAPLTALNDLETLAWQDSRFIENLDALNGLHLTRLAIVDFDQLSNASAIAGLPDLHDLTLSGCGRLNDLGSSEYAGNIRTIDLSYNRALMDITALSNCRGLVSLDISGCEELSDLAPLSTLRQLETLDISDCTGITNLEALKDLSQLTYLNVYGCEAVRDLSPLEDLGLLYLEGFE